MIDLLLTAIGVLFVAGIVSLVIHLLRGRRPA